MKKEFKKSDLKTGMQVELRNGNRHVVMLGTENGDFIKGINYTGWGSLSGYNNDLSHKERLSGDVVRVYNTHCCINFVGHDNKKMSDTYLVWQREQPKPILTHKGINWSEETLKDLIDKSLDNG